MTISVTCSNCGHEIQNLPESYAGLSAFCPNCDQRIAIPPLTTLRLEGIETERESNPNITPAFPFAADFQWVSILGKMIVGFGVAVLIFAFIGGLVAGGNGGAGAVFGIWLMGLAYAAGLLCVGGIAQVTVEIYKALRQKH
ncbi:MAG: hypothetical protein U0903_12225 [Planctomycetales bacterium]